jgi:large subunit ribosomal protein L17
MFRNMVTSLFKHERIRTTDTKAKEIRRWADKLVTLAKRGDLHARRQALAIINEKDVVHKLFEEAPKRFGEVNGGYTRVVKVGFRPGDAAPISMVELVTPEVKKKKTRRKKKAKKAAPTSAAVPTVEVAPETDETPSAEATPETATDAPAETASPADAPAEATDPKASPEDDAPAAAAEGRDDATGTATEDAAQDEAPKKDA